MKKSKTATKTKCQNFQYSSNFFDREYEYDMNVYSTPLNSYAHYNNKVDIVKTSENKFIIIFFGSSQQPGRKPIYIFIGER